MGVTNNLKRRIEEHKLGVGSDFTNKYKLYDLVYFERVLGMAQAIKRESQLKNWKRDWKIDLIKSVNPQMKDLTEIGIQEDSGSSPE